MNEYLDVTNNKKKDSILSQRMWALFDVCWLWIPTLSDLVSLQQIRPRSKSKPLHCRLIPWYLWKWPDNLINYRGLRLSNAFQRNVKGIFQHISSHSPVVWSQEYCYNYKLVQHTICEPVADTSQWDKETETAAVTAAFDFTSLQKAHAIPPPFTSYLQNLVLIS